MFLTNQLPGTYYWYMYLLNPDSTSLFGSHMSTNSLSSPGGLTTKEDDIEAAVGELNSPSPRSRSD